MKTKKEKPKTFVQVNLRLPSMTMAGVLEIQRRREAYLRVKHCHTITGLVSYLLDRHVEKGGEL